MFYDDEKKALVGTAFKAERTRLGCKLTRQERGTFSRTRIDAYFDAASPEELAEVNAELECEKEARLNPPPALADVSAARTPQEYQNAIDGADGALEKLVVPVAAQSGYCISVFGAGPCPRQAGVIHSFFVHFGTNMLGHSLSEATADFRDKFLKPMDMSQTMFSTGGLVDWFTNQLADSLAPTAPFTPAAPVAPVAPAMPAAPIMPATPIMSVAPIAPVAPVAPAAPIVPIAPVAPAGPPEEVFGWPRREHRLPGRYASQAPPVRKAGKAAAGGKGGKGGKGSKASKAAAGDKAAKTPADGKCTNKRVATEPAGNTSRRKRRR
ncbi:hypothetical protein C8T65DRAFT_737273 [Cerioporus squamosus]|nr:hypothetical protein C8T65DRAFT_737273 [Cerioporus squamosus]